MARHPIQSERHATKRLRARRRTMSRRTMRRRNMTGGLGKPRSKRFQRNALTRMHLKQRPRHPEPKQKPQQRKDRAKHPPSHPPKQHQQHAEHRPKQPQRQAHQHLPRQHAVKEQQNQKWKNLSSPVFLQLPGRGGLKKSCVSCTTFCTCQKKMCCPQCAVSWHPFSPVDSMCTGNDLLLVCTTLKRRLTLGTFRAPTWNVQQRSRWWPFSRVLKCWQLVCVKTRAIYIMQCNTHIYAQDNAVQHIYVHDSCAC